MKPKPDPLSPFECLVRQQLAVWQAQGQISRDAQITLAFLSGVYAEAAATLERRRIVQPDNVTLRCLAYVAAQTHRVVEEVGLLPGIDIRAPEPLTAGHFEGYPFDTEPC